MHSSAARTCFVAQPVGDVLAGGAQGGAVFHQADIVDVRYFGAAHAAVDPAHHVAKDALQVVVQLLLHASGVTCVSPSSGSVRLRLMSASGREARARALVGALLRCARII